MSFGASHQVGHLFNVIHHHDGCRLVHPAKWDIGLFRGAFVTDADWCISSGDSFSISFNSRCQELTDSFTIRFIIHIYLVSNITFQFHIHFLIIFSKIYSNYVLISYTHSCTHFIYSFIYSFHSYLVNYQNT